MAGSFLYIVKTCKLPNDRKGGRTTGMNPRIRYLLKNSSLFALSEVATKIINFILVPFYTYVLTKEQYGTVNLVFTFSTLLSPLIMLNIGEAVMRFLMDEDADDSKIRHIEFMIIAGGVLAGLALMPFLNMVPTVRKYIWYMYAYLIFLALRECTVGYLRGKEKLFEFAICNIANTTLIAVLNILFLVVFHWGIRGYFLAYIMAYATTSIGAFFVGGQHKGYRRMQIDKGLLQDMIRFSLAVIPNTMMWWIIDSSDHVMVSYMQSIEENALLTVAYKIPALLTSLSTIAMQGWKYSAINERDSEDKVAFSNRALTFYFHTMAVASATLLLANKWITSFLYAEAYHDAWRATAFLLVGNVCLSTATFFGTSYYVEKKMAGNFFSALTGAIVNIVFNALLIPHFGAAGATMAAAISYVVVLTYRYIDTQKYLPLTFWTPENLMEFAFLCAIMGATYFDHDGIAVILYLAFIAFNGKFILSTAAKMREILVTVFKKGKSTT